MQYREDTFRIDGLERRVHLSVQPANAGAPSTSPPPLLEAAFVSGRVTAAAFASTLTEPASPAFAVPAVKRPEPPASTTTVVPAAPSLPAAPSALTAAANSPTSVALSFRDNSTNETSFAIDRSTGGGAFVRIASLPGATGTGTRTWTDRAARQGTQYAYRVSAVNATGSSAFAGPVSAQTPPDTRNLLFFGNSFTLYNSMPALLQQVATADGHAAPNVYVQATFGWTLGQHLAKVNADGSANIIDGSLPAGQRWDDVVLQEYSTLPTSVSAPPVNGNPAEFRRDAEGLFARARANSPAVHGILMETWARGADNPIYPATFANPSAMQADLRSNYLAAAAQLSKDYGTGAAEVAPVGEAWRAQNWAKNLYDGPDEYHPSFRGSLLDALVVYDRTYHEKVSDIPAAKVALTLLAPHGLTATDWAQLTAAADATATI